jgi:hypothetical protein
MKSSITIELKPYIWFFFFFSLFFTGHAIGAGGLARAGEISAEESLRLGEAMYLNGVMPSGKPLMARVQGDVEASGKKVACSLCHLHSGLGSLIDDEILVLPINGARLYAPLLDPQYIPGTTMKRLMLKNPRPAYTDETLAKALLEGKDPAGRSLDAVMPRYLLDENATKVMVYYLKNLSSRFSPGITEEEIRFATIVTGDVSAADRDAMLLPLRASLHEEWNARMQLLKKHSYDGGTGKSNPTAGIKYRKASLDVWELKGPSETWPGQLEALYRQKPVFAILGGLATGNWAPIHAFCEKNRIPSVFPITDLPVISGTDWYTLYFSKGYYQEGETAANFMSRDAGLKPGMRVAQVFRDNEEGNALARGFSETWKKLGKTDVMNLIVSANEKTGREFWEKLSATYPQAALVVWLAPSDLAGIETLTGKNQPPVLFVSSTLLGGELASLPDKVRDFTFISYPTRLPETEVYAKSIASNWMKVKKIPVTNMEISSKVFVLRSVLLSALVELGGDFYRDFFLDILDGGREQATASVTYPLIRFGPGERYTSKGCYVVMLTKGVKPKLVKKADWAVY